MAIAQINFYHRTNAAEVILRDGSYMLVGLTLRGVFLSNVPLDCNDGAKGDQLLEVTLPEYFCDLDYYELVEEGPSEEGLSYREWCVPAEIINRQGKVRLLSESPGDARD